MPRSLPSVQFKDSQDLQLAEYRALPSQSLVGLLFGILSPIVFINPSIWAFEIVPLLGMFFSYWALRRIRKNPSGMTGRKRALLGFALSFVFIIALPAYNMTTQYLLNKYARQYGDAWFRLVLDNHLEEAEKMLAPARVRPSESSDSNKKQPQAPPVQFADTPLVQVLQTVGLRSRIRFYESLPIVQNGKSPVMSLVYAVTYDEGGEKNSFFVLLNVENRQSSDGDNRWQIAGVGGGYRPPEWKD